MAPVSKVDGQGTVGWYSSIAIGSDGLPVISYYSYTENGLEVTKCNDDACAGGDEQRSLVDGGGDRGFCTSLAIGQDGFPVVSYYDAGYAALKVAKCNDAACANFDETITVVDDVNVPGWYSSIAIASSGFPVVAYMDGATSSVRVATCSNAACTSSAVAYLTDPDSATIFGRWLSLVIGVDGLPVISCYEGDPYALAIIRCQELECGVASLEIVDFHQVGFGEGTSVAIGGDGFPIVSYHQRGNGGIDNSLKVVKCRSRSCFAP